MANSHWIQGEQTPTALPTGIVFLVTRDAHWPGVVNFAKDDWRIWPPVTWATTARMKALENCPSFRTYALAKYKCEELYGKD